VKIAKCYNYIVEGSKYTTDDNISFSNGVITLTTRGLLAPPIWTVAMKKDTGFVSGDCEDFTFAVKTFLRASGVKDVYACVGTITLYDPITHRATGTYGHACISVFYNNQWCLLETTLEKPLEDIKPVSSIKNAEYKVYYRFDDQDVETTIEKNVNIPLVYPPLPPAKIQDLKDALNSAN